MKKIFLCIAFLFTLLSFTTCKKQDIPNNTEDLPISVSITVENETSEEASIR
jgi:hypothetical protein